MVGCLVSMCSGNVVPNFEAKGPCAREGFVFPEEDACDQFNTSFYAQGACATLPGRVLCTIKGWGPMRN